MGSRREESQEYEQRGYTPKPGRRHVKGRRRTKKAGKMKVTWDYKTPQMRGPIVVNEKKKKKRKKRRSKVGGEREGGVRSNVGLPLH